MTLPFPPPRREGPQTLAPELARIIDALARAQEERDHAGRSQMPMPLAFGGGAQTPENPAFDRSRTTDNGTFSEP